MSICQINDKNQSSLTVIWDLGRRCTYACSYCPPHRKNDWSKTASLDDLIATAVNLEKYNNLYNKYRITPFYINTSFTGGEPTVNPAFFDFLEFLGKEYPHWNKTLTSNGFYTERKLRTVMENTSFTTISYHCEATPAQKEIVKSNMITMKKEGYKFKVNVMFHENEEYFQECIKLCEWLDNLSIPYTPRVIGDQGEVKEGITDKTIHTYSDQQMKWFKNYWNLKNNNSKVIKIENKSVGQSIGRPCCGGRKLELTNTNGDIIESSFIQDNNFNNWNCMINWYFLYIHQELGEIWHHQTCQVNMNNEIDSISSISNFGKYIENLSKTVEETNAIPYITCPKTYCGCGLCIPKAKEQEHSISLFKSHVKNLEPVITPIDVTNTKPKGTLKQKMIMFDKQNAS